MKNITLYDGPGYEFWKQFLLESPITEYNKLGENFLIADDWDNFYNLSEHGVIGAGTHAQIATQPTKWELEIGENKEINSGRGWYRSKDKLSGDYPYAGFLTTKKWHLNEV